MSRVGVGDTRPPYHAANIIDTAPPPPRGRVGMPYISTNVAAHTPQHCYRTALKPGWSTITILDSSILVHYTPAPL